MTLTALEQQLVAFNASILRWEEAGLRGSPVMHECRTLAQMVMVFQSQVKRAVEFLKEGKIDEARKELGDYVIVQ